MHVGFFKMLVLVSPHNNLALVFGLKNVQGGLQLESKWLPQDLVI